LRNISSVLDRHTGALIALNVALTALSFAPLLAVHQLLLIHASDEALRSIWRIAATLAIAFTVEASLEWLYARQLKEHVGIQSFFAPEPLSDPRTAITQARALVPGGFSASLLIAGMFGIAATWDVALGVQLVTTILAAVVLGTMITYSRLRLARTGAESSVQDTLLMPFKQYKKFFQIVLFGRLLPRATFLVAFLFLAKAYIQSELSVEGLLIITILLYRLPGAQQALSSTIAYSVLAIQYVE
jgi:hypothetical protein